MSKDINEIIPAEYITKVKAFLKEKFNLGVAPVAPAVPQVQAPVQPVALQESTLQDGTVIKYDTPTLAVGSVLTVVSPEGEMPAPVGEHTLADGTKITVGEGGKVESVTPGAPVAPPAAPVVQTADPLAQVKAEYDVKFKAFAAEKEVFQKQIETQKQEFAALRKDVGEFLEMFSQILELPTAKPVETPKNKKEKRNIVTIISESK